MAYLTIVVEFPDENWEGGIGTMAPDDLADALVGVAAKAGYVPRIAMGRGPVDPRWGRGQVQRHGRR